MFVRFLAVAAIAAMTSVSVAEAQVAGQGYSTTADLNLRSGIGTGFGIIAVVPRGQPVELFSCNQPVTWCNVSFRGQTGWVSARYLTPRPGAELAQPASPSGDPDQPSMITVSGMLTPEGIQCQALRGPDGRLYTLNGSVQPFRNGDQVRVRGQVAEMSICMQGTTIDVEAIEAAS